MVVALWPAPHNADACFADAGFHDFADPDDAWDEQWSRIVNCVLRELEHHGAPHILSAAEVYEYDTTSMPRGILGWLLPKRLPLKRMPLSLVEQILWVTADKRFGDVLVEFGAPTRVTLLAGRGHAILWVGWAVADTQPEAFVEGIAGSLPVVKTDLDWQVLLPNFTQGNHQ
jgi:hypothetical protein